MSTRWWRPPNDRPSTPIGVGPVERPANPQNLASWADRARTIVGHSLENMIMTMMQASQRLVLLATGVRSEPRGAWFEPAHTADLVQAAGRGGLHLVEVEAGALRSLDADLPAGQLLAPGRPSPLPPIRRATFDVLIALPGIVVPPRQVASDPDVGRGGQLARKHMRLSPRRRLRVGSVVLASMDAAEGWFEAEILAIADDGELQLRWRDFRSHDEFTKPLACITAAPAGNMR